jgi:DNA-binding FadR family transcriptional regulator
MRDTVDTAQLDRSSTAHRVAANLRARIADGTIGPGERLNELSLAAELGISRSPIREAKIQEMLETLRAERSHKGALVGHHANKTFTRQLGERLADGTLRTSRGSSARSARKPSAGTSRERSTPTCARTNILSSFRATRF